MRKMYTTTTLCSIMCKKHFSLNVNQLFSVKNIFNLNINQYANLVFVMALKSLADIA